MSFKVVITDNDNGKELVNEKNVTTIIGGLSDGENVREIVFAAGKARSIIAAALAAKNSVSQVEYKHPEIGLMLKLEDMLKKCKEGEEND